MLNGPAVTSRLVQQWISNDEPILLLRLAAGGPLPAAVRDYLGTEEATGVRQTYKCRNRDPWYVVPDVYAPDGFLTYMSGRWPQLVSNQADCVATNSVHTVRLRPGYSFTGLRRLWNSPLTELSCELEGHPLGGGLLKIEPREAAKIVLGKPVAWSAAEQRQVRDGLKTIRMWRHCDSNGNT